MGLRERIHEVEGDSEEAFRARRQIARLLVEGIIIEDKRKGEEARVRITYRFDEPSERGEGLWEVSRNTNEFLKEKPRPGVRAAEIMSPSYKFGTRSPAHLYR